MESVALLRGDFLNKLFFFVTSFGTWYMISIFFIIVSLLFWIYKKKDLIFPFLISILGTGVLTLLIKSLVNRSRPPVSLALYAEKGASFPSAHAALSFALFGFLIYCFWKFNLSLRLKIILTIIFTAVVFLIGFSRLYLGVHFITDILAGYVIGLICILVSVYICKKLSWFRK